MKLLVLDNNKFWLEKWQKEGVPTATSIQEARAIVEASGIDTVLLKVEWLYLCPALEELGVKIVAITGLPINKQAIAAYKAGGHSHRVIDYVAMDFGMTVETLAERLAA